MDIETPFKELFAAIAVNNADNFKVALGRGFKYWEDDPHFDQPGRIYTLWKEWDIKRNDYKGHKAFYGMLRYMALARCPHKLVKTIGWQLDADTFLRYLSHGEHMCKDYFVFLKLYKQFKMDIPVGDTPVMQLRKEILDECFDMQGGVTLHRRMTTRLNAKAYRLIFSRNATTDEQTIKVLHDLSFKENVKPVFDLCFNKAGMSVDALSFLLEASYSAIYSLLLRHGEKYTVGDEPLDKIDPDDVKNREYGRAQYNPLHALNVLFKWSIFAGYGQSPDKTYKLIRNIVRIRYMAREELYGCHNAHDINLMDALYDGIGDARKFYKKNPPVKKKVYHKSRKDVDNN